MFLAKTRRRQACVYWMLSVSGEMGGAEHSFLEILRALPKERIQARACVPPGGSLERLCHSAEIPVTAVHLRRFRRTTNPFILAGQVKALYQGSRIISELCKTQTIDILYANNDSGGADGLGSVAHGEGSVCVALPRPDSNARICAHLKRVIGGGGRDFENGRAASP